MGWVHETNELVKKMIIIIKDYLKKKKKERSPTHPNYQNKPKSQNNKNSSKATHASGFPNQPQNSPKRPHTKDVQSAQVNPRSDIHVCMMCCHIIQKCLGGPT